jgi:YHS domain-containing protein
MGSGGGRTAGQRPPVSWKPPRRPCRRDRTFLGLPRTGRHNRSTVLPREVVPIDEDPGELPRVQERNDLRRAERYAASLARAVAAPYRPRRTFIAWSTNTILISLSGTATLVRIACAPLAGPRKEGAIAVAKKSKAKRLNHVKANNPRDPQCGKVVQPAKAIKLTWEGKAHFFCSDECRRKFEQDPPGDAGF